MLQSTRSLNRDSIALGIAELYIGDSATHIAETGRVLTLSYPGAMMGVSLVVTKEFKQQFTLVNNIQVLSDMIQTAGFIAIAVEMLEITKENIERSLGGTAKANVINTLLTQPTDLRVEMVFTYPNRINKMEMIFPRVKSTAKSVPWQFEAEDAMTTPLVLSVLATDNAAWTNDPYGKITFV